MNAALNTSQSVLEMAGSWAVLAAMPAPPIGRLAALGAVSIACASLSAIVGARPLKTLGHALQTGKNARDTRKCDCHVGRKGCLSV